MKALLISDLHGDQKFLTSLESMIKYYAVILCAGDLTDFGWPENYVSKLEKVVGLKPFFWVSGNNDVEQSYQYSSKILKNIDGKIVNHQNIKIAGLGGSYQNFESQNYGPSLIGENPDLSESILLTHIPPSVKLQYSPVDLNCSKNDETMKPPEGGSPFGGQLTNSPLVHICGHLHSKPGVACLGQTKVIKLAPAKFGEYAELDTTTLAVKFSTKGRSASG